MNCAVHSQAWYRECFTNPGTGKLYPVPPAIRAFSERICTDYNINGICDPLYVANTLAAAIGCGDGASHFYPGDYRPSEGTITRVAEAICRSYRSNIFDPPAAIALIIAQHLYAWPRMESVLAAAEDAFWDSVARCYPEVKSGDFPPDAHHAFRQSCAIALKVWLEHNLFARKPEERHERTHG